VRGERKMGLRSEFFQQLLARTEVHMVNTTLSPQGTQLEIRKALGLSPQA